MPGVKDVVVGINRIKEYMEFDEERINPFTKEKGSTRFFVSDRCPILITPDCQRLKWETVKTNRGAQNLHEKVRKFFRTISLTRYGGGMVAFTTASLAKELMSLGPKRGGVLSKGEGTRVSSTRTGEYSIEKIIKESNKTYAQFSRSELEVIRGTHRDNRF